MRLKLLLIAVLVASMPLLAGCGGHSKPVGGKHSNVQRKVDCQASVVVYTTGFDRGGVAVIPLNETTLNKSAVC